MADQSSVDRALRILIVDDDVDNAQSLGELFELYGHQVSLVHSGDAAVSAYVDHTFDIAFMDVMMPGKNGVESFLEIRKLKPSAKVVMMTGYSVEQLLQQAMDNGAMGVLTKPMETSRALDILNEIGPKGILVVPGHNQSTRPQLQQALQAAGKKFAVLKQSPTAGSFSQNTDVVIIDLKKPLIDGVGCYSELKRAGLSVPAIIYADAIADFDERGDGLDDFRLTGILNKPFDPHHLLTTVHHILA